MNKRNSNSRFYFLSLLGIVLVWGIFSLPYFLGKGVPYPSAQLVNSFAPWIEYEEFKGPEKNVAMPDVVDQLFPWKKFTIDSYKSGNIPFWNPNSFAGNYHIGTYQSALFSPINLLFFILPFIDAWSLAVILQPLIAGVGMYLYAYHRLKNYLPALLSAISFMFCGFITVWMPYTTLSLAISFLPLLLLALDNIEKRVNWWTVLAVVATAFSFLSGHFQISTYLLVFAFWYCIFLYTLQKEKLVLLHRVLALGGGIALSLIQLIPSFFLYINATRSDDFFTEGGIPFWYLITVVIPDFFGNPVKRNDWIGHCAEWAGYVGIIAFLFFIFSFYKRKDKVVRFFIISTFINLYFALDTPMQWVISALHIPVFSTSYPTRVIVLASFCVCMLAGFGMQQLLEMTKEKKKVFLTIGGYVVSLFLIVGVSKLFLPPDKAMIALKNSVIPLFLLGCAVGCILIYLFIKQEKLRKAALVGIILLASVESLLFATRWVPFEPREKVYPETVIMQQIEKHRGSGRVYGNLGNQVYSYYQIPSLEGYDPLYVGRYGEFIRASDPSSDFGLKRSVIKIPPQSKNIDKLLDFLGVSLIYHPRSHMHQPWGYASVWNSPYKFEIAFEDEKVQLFKNRTAMERAKLYCSYTVINDDKKLLETFYGKDFPYRETVLLEQNPEKRYGEYCEKVEGKVTLSKMTSDSVQVDVESVKPALLFLSDTHFPLWKVQVNGEDSSLYRADYAFRAVEVPKGKSRVVFTLSLFP